ncbi:prolyl oligopeptidase family serine peptidase [Sphingomonas sp.]|uniref:prolyl oligopeptidase family serine peptidase n=1 Tax=Sphingomonas sp. TaxID=28214 RepID=UPI003B00FD74
MIDTDMAAHVRAYPETRRGDDVDEHFGVRVADPYRWLEADVRTDEAVRDWADAQHALTERHLGELPARETFARRLAALWNYRRVSLPVARGERLFHLVNDGLDRQPRLCVRQGEGDESRVLVDPLAIDPSGGTALAEWAPSRDGRRLAYALAEAGSDWRTIRVLDVATGELAADAVAWVKFSHIAWAANGSGFFYSRFPAPAAGAEHLGAGEDHAVWFHRIGTPQSKDYRVYASPDRPRLMHVAETTHDGRWLLVSSSEGTDARHELTLIDLAAPKLRARTLIRGLENEWRLAGSEGDLFYFLTDLDAPRRRIVAMDVASTMRRLREVVPEGADVLTDARLIGGRLLIAASRDVASVLRVASTDGRSLDEVTLPGTGAVTGLSGEPDQPHGWFGFTSYDRPNEIHRLDMATPADAIWARPELTFDPDRFVVEQTVSISPDGTRVPLFLLRRRDVTGPAPTILYGYGGFAIALEPAFSAAALAWAERGGVWAVACIRGGGEYGRAWHEAAKGAVNRPVAYADFEAAAEQLVADGIAAANGLAIHGHSNGGLLVAAVTNRRPELFAAALPAVGVHDLIRFPRFTAGRYWIDDYGDPGREADFPALLAISPLHQVRDGTPYPAILVATADTDDRVVPAHSFKYAATLQAAELGDKPRLIRIEQRAGHGAGKPVDRQIAETADTLAFAARWTGLA